MKTMSKKQTVTLTEYMLHKASYEKIPLSGTFELSPLCNFSCQMCYVRKTEKEVKEHPRKMLQLEQWMKIAEEAHQSGMLYLLLTGGEPLLWLDFWELYEKLVNMGFLVSINTNGSLLDKKTVERLKKLPPRRVNITLYGASDETYEKLCNVKGVFSKVDQGIMELKKAGIQVKLNCSLTPSNAEDLEEMVRYAKERELILDIASYMFPPIRRNPEMIGENKRFTPEESARYRLKAYCLQNGERKYLEYLQNILDGSVSPPGLDENCIDPLDGKIRCRAGKASFWITWDGWLTPCGLMNEPKVDLKEKSFIQAWEMLTDESDRLITSGLCAHCPNQETCHPCAAMALAETGNISGTPTYLCKMVQEMQKVAREEIALRI